MAKIQFFLGYYFATSLTNVSVHEPPILGALLSKAATKTRPPLCPPSPTLFPLARPDTERQSGKSSLTTAAGLVHGTIFFCMSVLVT